MWESYYFLVTMTVHPLLHTLQEGEDPIMFAAFTVTQSYRTSESTTPPESPANSRKHYAWIPKDTTATMVGCFHMRLA